MIPLLADFITDSTSTIQDYMHAAILVGVSVLLFTVGRRVVSLLIVDKDEYEGRDYYGDGEKGVDWDDV